MDSGPPAMDSGDLAVDPGPLADGGETDCGASCPPDAGTQGCVEAACPIVCDLAGSFALRLDVPATWEGNAAVQAGNGMFQFWSKLQLSQSGTSLNGMLTPCGEISADQVTIASIGETYGVIYSHSIFDRTPTLPATPASGALGDTTPGSSFVLARSAVLIGLEMNDPVNDAWPSSSSVQDFDADEDGKLGITVPYKSGRGYSYPAVNNNGTARASKVYLARRIIFALNGTLTSCTQASGPSTVEAIEARVLGCRITTDTRDCSDSERDHLDMYAANRQASDPSYTLVKVADDATCGDVRSALP